MVNEFLKERVIIKVLDPEFDERSLRELDKQIKGIYMSKHTKDENK